MTKLNKSFSWGLVILITLSAMALIYALDMYYEVEYIAFTYGGVFFWTGFLQYGIERAGGGTNTSASASASTTSAHDDHHHGHPQTQATLYTMLEEWDKRVEIDVKYDFFSSRLSNHTYANDDNDDDDDFVDDDDDDDFVDDDDDDDDFVDDDDDDDFVDDDDDDDFVDDDDDDDNDAMKMEYDSELDLGLEDDRDYIYFLDGILAMSNNGEPDKAIQYLKRYNPATTTQKKGIEANIELMEYHKKIIHHQKEYIQLAIDLLETYEFSDSVPNPHIYFDYVTFFELAQMVLLWYTYRYRRGDRPKKRMTFLMVQSLTLLITSILHLTLLSVTHLERLLFEIPYKTLLSSLIFTDAEIAHKPSVTLERARQIFIKYPYVHDDLCSHKVMSLMYQVMSREVTRCNHPNPHPHPHPHPPMKNIGSDDDDDHELRSQDDEINDDDIEPCKSTHRVIHTIADMIDIYDDASFSICTAIGYTDTLDFWYTNIDYAIEIGVTPSSSSTLDQTYDMKRSDRMRAIVDDWLQNIIGMDMVLGMGMDSNEENEVKQGNENDNTVANDDEDYTYYYYDEDEDGEVDYDKSEL